MSFILLVAFMIKNKVYYLTTVYVYAVIDNIFKEPVDYENRLMRTTTSWQMYLDWLFPA